MSDYVDLVLTDNLSVFIAPYCSGLKLGDVAVIKSRTSVYLCEVRQVISCSRNSDEYAFIKELIGSEPLRIASKTVEFDYGEGDSDV